MRFQAGDLQGRLTSNDEIFLKDFKHVYFAEPRGDAHDDVSYSVFVDRQTGQKKHRATRNGEILAITATYRSLIPALERDISRTLVGLYPRRCYLRASLLSVEDIGILLLEDHPSMGGWLEKALIEGGARLHSQGMTILDHPQLSGVPLVKSVCLVTPASPLTSRETRLRTIRERPGDFVRYWKPGTAQTADPSVPQEIGCILVTGRERSDPPRLEPLAKSDALDCLMRNTYNVEAWDQSILSYLIDIVEKPVCYSLIRGLSSPTVNLIVQRVRTLRMQ